MLDDGYENSDCLLGTHFRACESVEGDPGSDVTDVAAMSLPLGFFRTLPSCQPRHMGPVFTIGGVNRQLQGREMYILDLFDGCTLQ